MSGQDGVQYPHARQTAARVGGSLLITGGLLAVILLAVGPGFAHGKTGATLPLASTAIAVGLFCVIFANRVPGWLLVCIGPFGGVLIATSSIITRTATDGSELLYMWTVLFAAYFLAMRYAVITVVLIAAVYPAVAISILGSPGITPSVYLVGTSVVTLLIVSRLRGQLARVLTRTALEARTDPLTGLANRRSWEEALARDVTRRERHGGPLSVLLMDLDHFKTLNDTYGHPAGDVALVGVAAVLRGQARQSDVLARVGGEEFALLLADCAGTDAVHRAEEIRRAVQRESAGWATPVTISVGVASAPEHAGTGRDLMAVADVALYEAKRGGRNRVRLAAPAASSVPR